MAEKKKYFKKYICKIFDTLRNYSAEIFKFLIHGNGNFAIIRQTEGNAINSSWNFDAFSVKLWMTREERLTNICLVPTVSLNPDTFQRK